MGALLLRTLRHNRWLLPALLVGLAAIELVIVHIAADFASGPGLEKLLGALPGFVRELVTSRVKDLSFPTVVAFGFGHPATLVAGLGFVLLLATAPAAEAESGLLDLFLARPLGRGAYLAATLVTLLAVALLLPAVLLAGCALGLATADVPSPPPAWTDYLSSAANLSTLLLAVGGVALASASGSSRRGQAVTRVIGLLVISYLVEFFAPFWAPLQSVRPLSLFHWFHPMTGLTASEPTPLIDGGVLLAVFAAGTLYAFRRFATRDV